ncbi:hypothetical protein BK659_08410 [Pseudomonas brassicacearum]|uniref:UspA domain-containing protein n=1 Tax=Pseudomonas brassicacearum TaxID=930166 RepID=A0A423H9N7_9PSED|nr:hypothetical protein BK659_08410 [Pseudomonas brassicacearum]
MNMILDRLAVDFQRTFCEFSTNHLTDIIVMGTVQHRGLNKRLGSTAEHLLHQAPCSVLAIKPGELLQS